MVSDGLVALLGLKNTLALFRPEREGQGLLEILFAAVKVLPTIGVRPNGDKGLISLRIRKKTVSLSIGTDAASLQKGNTASTSSVPSC